MRSVQLTGLHQEDVHNKGMGGETDSTMQQTARIYLCHTGMGKFRNKYL